MFCCKNIWQYFLFVVRISSTFGVSAKNNEFEDSQLDLQCDGKLSLNNPDALTLVNRLGMKAHPEGGFFSEDWRSSKQVLVADPGLAAVRDLGSNINYLLRTEDFSAWHRVKEAQIYYWHAGGTLQVHLINETGALNTTYLCSMLYKERCRFSVYIPHWTWVAIEPTPETEFVLIGNAAFPGFEYDDWELGKREWLVEKFPQHRTIIERLTRI